MTQIQYRQPHSREYDRERISILDPLNGDGLLSHVPEMNASADLSAMADAVRVLLPTDCELAMYSCEECLAVMRDFGLLLGSIKRHGTQPLTLVPELEPVLLELGRRTDMIPRDTVHHYTEWNPRGPRQRMYTGKPQEGFLMDAVRLSLPHLGQAVELCKVLSNLDPTESAFEAALEALAEQVSFFDQAITEVVAKVTPEFFAQEMRPYYEEVTVSGIDYLGPAAAHVPLFLVDLAVWASDHGDPTYETFLHEGVQHTLPQWRDLVPVWEQKPSLVSQVSAAFAAFQPDEVPQTLQQTAETLFRVLRTLAIFRGKHFGIAKKAYRHDISIYELGSGGGSIDLLRTILDLTRQNARLVHQAHIPHKEDE